MQTSTITVVGNLTRDPQFRILKDGSSTATAGIAVNRRWTTKDGTTAESTVFYTVVVWGASARNITASLRKGDRVVAIGRLEPREWTDQQGERHLSVEIVADELAPSLRYGCATLERRRARTEGAAEAGETPDDDASLPMDTGAIGGVSGVDPDLEELMAQAVGAGV